MGEQQPPAGAEGSGSELFDRWLAHHHQEPRPTPAEPVAAPADPEADPLFDGDFVTPEVTEPPATFEEIRQELGEPVALEAFVPVVIPAAKRRRRGRRTPVPAPLVAPAAEPVAVAAEPAVEEEPDPAPALEPVPEPEPEPEPVPEPEPAPVVQAPPAPRPTPAPAPAPAPAPTPAPAPHEIAFAPRTGARRAIGLLLLVGVAATAASVAAAVLAPSDARTGIAVVVGGVTAFVWAVRAGSAVTTLHLRGGQLEVQRAGGRFVFDLTSRYTPVEVVGEPGRRGWEVRFLRRGMSPFVIDSSDVDPHAFTEALLRYRPEPGPTSDTQ